MSSNLDRIISLADSGGIVEGNLKYFLSLALEYLSSAFSGVVATSIWIKNKEAEDSFKCLYYLGDQSSLDDGIYGNSSETNLQSPIFNSNDVCGYIYCEFDNASAKSKADLSLLNQVGEQLNKVYQHKKYLKVELFSGINYQQIINDSSDAIMIMSNGLLVECNQATVDMFKAPSKAALFGIDADDLSSDIQPGGLSSNELVLKYVESARYGRSEVFSWDHKRFNGEIFSSQVSLSSIDVGGNNFILAVVRDFSGEERAHQKSFDRATFCQVTGFYNQDALVEIADKISSYHLILVNIKSLSEVSHVLGMAAEKDYLRILSKRIKRSFSRKDILIGRGRESEFCFLVSDSEMENLEVLVKKIELCMDKSVVLSGVDIPSENYFGIVPSELIIAQDSHWQSARSAINIAKQTRVKSVWFDEKIKESGVVRSLLITDLKNAIEQNQLYLLYQPKLSLKSNRIESVEALVRWKHPEKGIIPPDLFIPLAEKTEFIHDVTRWVINTCCQQAATWKSEGLDIMVALNLSSRDLADERLIDYIQYCLSEHQLSSKSLQLEITESAALQDKQQSIATIAAIKELGLSVAIDDYGTGYSSLSHLRTFPFDVLKIDRSFITDLVSSKMNQAVVKSTISMCHDMGFSIVAEGIEDEVALNLLRDWGCDIAQGYFISRPISAENIKFFIGENK